MSSAATELSSSTQTTTVKPPSAPNQRHRHRQRQPRNADAGPSTDGATPPPQENFNNGRARTQRGGGQQRRPRDASQYSGGSSSVPASDMSDRDKPVRRSDGAPSKPRRRPFNHAEQAHSKPSNSEDSKDLPGDSSKPPPPHRKRGARFNGSLSEPTAALKSAHAKEPVSKRYAQQSSKDDDLTTILTRALSTSPYPDCPICFAPIHPAQPTWSCSPSSSAHLDTGLEISAMRLENAQCCWTTFHLKCIRPWADKNVKDVEAAWLARGESRKGDWRCPGCQTKREVVPRIYWCFCGSIQDPKPPRLSTPHSCASPCTRARVCGHPCPLACHPGPCPPCMVTTQLPCFCTKQTIAFLCSRSRPGRGTHLHGGVDLSCGAKCEKALSCGNHFCQNVCHDGDCESCPVRDLVSCYCGKEERGLSCGQGEEEGCVIMRDGVEQRWTGKFACENTCDQPFDCGVHKCEKPCHPPSRTPPLCPRSPSLVTHCPCGKHSLSDPSSEPFFPLSTKLVRETCSDPIPTCASLCMKPLNGCEHLCAVKCHTGGCPPCTIPIVRPCRCGATTREILCHQSQEGLGSEEILCEKPCRALRNCGNHQCNRICCPLASLASVAKGKNKKRAGAAQLVDAMSDEAGWHQCDLVCGKLLECGNHYCEERDHRGPCPTCLRSTFEEMVCHCGRTVLEPPIPCGTRITCTFPCLRPPPDCGHPRARHACHEDPTPCPPCAFLTAKVCACGKKTVPNKPCFSEKVSCGTPCDKLLGCGFHRCARLCHSDACGPCTAVCGKAHKLCLPAQHPCTHPCHAPSACPETEACTASVIISCPCGRMRQSVQCGRCTANPAGREATQLKCTNECAIAKRNARLAEALGISPDARKLPEIVYSESVLSFARANPKFIPVVEKAFADFITSDKKVQVLPHMPESRRRFVHDLAAVYRMDTQMVDQEPNRSVQLIRRIDSRLPNPLLSTSLSVSQAALGKLTNLRASSSSSAWPRAQTSSQASVPESHASRGWTSVVAKAPAHATAQTPLRSGSSLSTEAGLAPRTTAVRATRSPAAVSPRAGPVSDLTPASSGVAPTVTASEDVPDDWEDDV